MYVACRLRPRAGCAHSSIANRILPEIQFQPRNPSPVSPADAFCAGVRISGAKHIAKHRSISMPRAVFRRREAIYPVPNVFQGERIVDCVPKFLAFNHKMRRAAPCTAHHYCRSAHAKHRHHRCPIAALVRIAFCGGGSMSALVSSIFQRRNVSNIVFVAIDRNARVRSCRRPGLMQDLQRGSHNTSPGTSVTNIRVQLANHISNHRGYVPSGSTKFREYRVGIVICTGSAI